jgi:hypothetical protein
MASSTATSDSLYRATMDQLQELNPVAVEKVFGNSSIPTSVPLASRGLGRLNLAIHKKIKTCR